MFSRVLIRQLSTQSPIQEVVIMGGGLMGAGVAQIAAQTNHKVTLVDLNPDILSKSETRIQQSMGRVAKKMFKDDKKAIEAFVEDSMSCLTLTSSPESSLASADLVVEAITENLPLKQERFYPHFQM